jgi:hypothetical protein
LYPYDTWSHPIYGDTTIDKDIASKLKENFDHKVKDAHVFTDYEHGMDKAKGNKASGELVKVDVRDDGLWGLVQFTDDAKREIEAGEWNYWSTSHYDTWTHPQSKESFNYVLDGGGLTNKPWIKGMLPLNFSEIMFAEKKAPYGNVTYADPGYRSDRKKRYPLDTETHIRAAWSYINMPKNAKFYTSSQLASIKSKIRAAMKRIGAAVKASELVTEMELEGEVAPEEFQEPGTGIIDPSVNEDDSYPNRVDTPPPGEDGSVPDRPVTGGEMTPDEIIAALREKLALSDDTDIVAHVSGMNDELEPLRELKKEHSEKKQFAEAYPAEYERLQKLEQDSRENFAKNFSEKLGARRFSKATADKDDEGNAVLESTTVGLSAKAIDEIEGIVKKFGENTATLEDFSGVLDAVLDSGIVDYGNIGSTREPEPEVREPKNSLEGRKMFAEKVNEIVEKDELTFDAALVEAAKRYPSLYESWLSPVSIS